MPRRFLIYGATGYAGKLIARAAEERGLRPVLAGRDGPKLAALATSLGFEHRALRLEERDRLTDALHDVDVVVNTAGPFSETARPIVDACLRTGTHYLDLTGELPVFESLQQRHEEARARNLMVMPGIGFVVVATDCLAAHVAQRLPGARRLSLGVSRAKHLSRGSLKTIIQLWSSVVYVRRQGRLLPVPIGSVERQIDYGAGLRSSAAVSWPDLVTAFRTTGIPNVSVYLEVSYAERAMFRLNPLFYWWLGSPPGRNLLQMQSNLLPEGPSDYARSRDRRVVVAEVEGDDGTRVCSRLRTPESYTFTGAAALGVVEEVLQGRFLPGFQTPAAVYGADFPLKLEGVEREDVAPRQAGERFQSVSHWGEPDVGL